MENTELQHWGIKGMKWGVRRYQNKDGTLTPAGKKRYDSEMERVKYETKVLRNKKRTQAKIDKLDAMKKTLKDMQDEVDPKKKKTTSDPDPKDTDVKPRKKTVSEMSDEDLAKAIRRSQLEQQYKQLHPEEVSKGDNFVKKMWKESVTPAIISSGKKFLEGFLDKKLGEVLDKTPVEESLKDKASRLKNIRDIMAYEDEIAKKQAARRAKTDAATKEKAESDARKKQEETGRKYYNEPDDDGVFRGTVSGEGTSKGSQSRSSSFDPDNVIDVDYKSVPDSYFTTGEQYVRGLLGDGGMSNRRRLGSGD